MITLSNGHTLEYIVAAGAMAYDGKGWPWERPLVATGIIKPELFVTATKSLTRHPRAGNLRWWKPWTSVRLLPGGSMVNAIGLTNPGIEWWLRTIAARMEYPLIVSIYGASGELVEMARMLDDVPLVGIEVNVSCPNACGGAVVNGAEAVASVSRHPVICKVNVAQDYLGIAREIERMAEAISFNSVPWDLVLGAKPFPSGGGVSGRAAQKHNWRAMRRIADSGCTIPLIASSIMEHDDLARAREYGASAYSFGAIHMLRPWAPSRIVEREIASGAVSEGRVHERGRASAPVEDRMRRADA